MTTMTTPPSSPSSPWRTLRTLIPSTIAYYPTKQDFEGTGGVGTAAPVDNTKPFQPWRDNQAHYPNSSWFGGGPSMVSYTTFATHKDTGALQLHAIDSKGFLETYSLTVINVYREYRHLFTKGVPVLTPLILSTQVAAEFNYGYNGTFTPPPASINTNIMLAPGPDGEWMAIDYQAWLQIQRTANQATDEQKVAKAVAIGTNLSISAKDKVSAMRVALQDTPTIGPLI